MLIDFRATNETLRELCARFAGDNDHWRMYYNDVWKWRKLDKEFDDAMTDEIQRKSGKVVNIGGRPRKDGGDDDWKAAYCKALLKYSGNRVKAAEATPYQWSTILQKLDPAYTEYDMEFAQMVKNTELQMAAIAEELLISTLDPANYENFEAAKIAQIKSRNASAVLEKLDTKRYGRHITVENTGTVRHQLENRNAAQLFATLVNEQQSFMQSRGILQLPAKSESVEVVDAEYVPVETRED